MNWNDYFEDPFFNINDDNENNNINDNKYQNEEEIYFRIPDDKFFFYQKNLKH